MARWRDPSDSYGGVGEQDLHIAASEGRGDQHCPCAASHAGTYEAHESR